MNYKIITSSVIATIVLSILAILIAVLLKIFVNGINLAHSPIAYFKLILYAAVVGFIIGMLLFLIRNNHVNGWVELSICLVVCLISMVLLSSNFTSSLEGTWIWFSLTGLLFGLLVFLSRRLVLKLM
jgi:hypothetical protein